jgi:Dullard-like phosphatase family protein
MSEIFRTLKWECTEYYTPPPMLSPQKTLILDLDETLIHSSNFPPHRDIEAFRIGEPQFYVFKRPGLDGFLKFVRERFEVFVFTYGSERYAKPIIDHLIPWLDEDHKLYREACAGKKGPCKNLKIFDRSKKRLILIDDSEQAMSTNPENTIQISQWCGVPTDHALIDWVPEILEKCAMAEDVRVVIRQTAGGQRERRDSGEGIFIEL